MMNNKLQSFARQTMLDGLDQCTDGQIRRFKQIYAGGNLERTIEDVVANMPEEKLDWAMQQVERTLAISPEKGTGSDS